MSTLRITAIKGREILDSKGYPTVEADVEVEGRFCGRASAPCGTSTGRHESVFLRDGGSRFLGHGVLQAVANVNGAIAMALERQTVSSQEEFDAALCALDPTERKSLLGANALCAVSAAFARAASAAAKVPLYAYLAQETSSAIPRPAYNLLNGYSPEHEEGCLQEYLLIPTANSYPEALQVAVEVFSALGKLIAQQFGPRSVQTGPSAGYVAPSLDPAVNLRLLLEAAERAGYGDEVQLGIDCAASQLFDEGASAYRVGKELVPPAAMADLLRVLCSAFPIRLLEDPLHEDDLAGSADLQSSTSAIVVGDDLFASRLDRVKSGVQAHAAKGVVLKPNMVGTLSETIVTAQYAHQHRLALVGSIRSRSTCDDPIPDLAMAVRADFIKPGAPRSGERTACSNALLRAAEDPGVGPQLSPLETVVEWAHAQKGKA